MGGPSRAVATGESGLARPFAVVVLAAGASTRLGRPKQLESLDGRPLLRHVVDAAALARPDQLVVVLGHHGAAIAAALADAPGEIVHNPDARAGQSTSLAAGLAAVRADIERVVILLGDQPHVDPGVIVRVAEGEGPARRARYRDRPGHPVALDRELFGRLELVSGDEGARSLLRELSDQVREVHVDADAPLDLDTEEDARALGVRRASPPRK